jgi:uncharacterized protein (DUF2236 family)
VLRPPSPIRYAGGLGRGIAGTALDTGRLALDTGRLARETGRVALDTAARPLQDAVNRDVRRSLGLRGEPRPPVADPDLAFLPPDGVARRIHADLASMVIGGLSALLLQTLHPLAMAGVAEHSNYADDPVGRLRRTAMFVGRTTFGSIDDARGAIGQVRRVHERVRGVAPDGRPYAADDPDLVTWVHVTEMTSFLTASRRYGPNPVSDPEADDYLAETAVVAYELGARWVPTSLPEVEAYFLRVRPELYAGPQAMAARDFLLRGVAHRPADRAVHAVIAAAAVGILPRWARSELGLPTLSLVDTAVVTPVAWAFCAGLRWAVTPTGQRAAGNSHVPAGRPPSGGEREAAVDGHHLAGGVGGRGQGDDDLGDVVRLPAPS